MEELEIIVRLKGDIMNQSLQHAIEYGAILLLLLILVFSVFSLLKNNQIFHKKTKKGGEK